MNVNEAFAKRDEARKLMEDAEASVDATARLLVRSKETFDLAKANFEFHDRMLGLAIQAEDEK